MVIAWWTRIFRTDEVVWPNVIRAWMNSPGHRRNILNPKVTEFGVARAPGNYWVLVMARPGC